MNDIPISPTVIPTLTHCSRPLPHFSKRSTAVIMPRNRDSAYGPRDSSAECLLLESSQRSKPAITSLPPEIIFIITSFLGPAPLAIPLKHVCRSLYHILPPFEILRGAVFLWDGTYLLFETLKSITESKNSHTAAILLVTFPGSCNFDKFRYLWMFRVLMIDKRTGCNKFFTLFDKESGEDAWILRTGIQLGLDPFRRLFTSYASSQIDETTFHTHVRRLLPRFFREWECPLCPHISLSTDTELLELLSSGLTIMSSGPRLVRRCQRCCTIIKLYSTRRWEDTLGEYKPFIDIHVSRYVGSLRSAQDPQWMHHLAINEGKVGRHWNVKCKGPAKDPQWRNELAITMRRSGDAGDAWYGVQHMLMSKRRHTCSYP